MPSLPMLGQLAGMSRVAWLVIMPTMLEVFWGFTLVRLNQSPSYLIKLCFQRNSVDVIEVLIR